MAKTYLSTVKYVIKTKLTVDGIVDKHDIIGAVFGQSEGLIGEEMDLKELQKNGKLGRIEVETQIKSGKTVGSLMIPSSLDRVQTSILAAAIESVDKVGPCNSTFQTESIEDARQEKRKVVTERAKELLMKMSAGMPETQELTETIRERARTAGVKEIGREKVAIGPEAETSPDLILVEGRADVINLLKHGIKNVAGVGGAKVPRTVVSMAKGKHVTVFVDGDRGGDIIARQLSRAMDVEFVARAPDGKEVEELTLKEILGSLRKKEETGKALEPRRRRFETERREPVRRERSPQRREGRSPRTGYGSRSERSPGTKSRYERPRTRYEGPGSRSPRGRNDRPRAGYGPRPAYRPREESKPYAKEHPSKPNDLGEFSKHMAELEGSLKARVIDGKMGIAKEVNVRDLLKEIAKHKDANAIVLDGIITKRLLAEAEKHGVKQLVGMKKGKIEETGKVKVSALY